MQYRRISADCHLDLPWLPPELFVAEARRELTDRMPYVEDGPDGPQWVTKAGVNMGLVGGTGSVGGKFVPGQNLRIGFDESGICWLPYALDRMDFEWEDRFRDLGLKMRPSEYWRRQCRATFQFDRIGAKLVEGIGVETLMWGSDYPHRDGVWPESSRYIEEQFAGSPAEAIHKITCENAGKFYGLVN